jgi:hypothetical protein
MRPNGAGRGPESSYYNQPRAGGATGRIFGWWGTSVCRPRNGYGNNHETRGCLGGGFVILAMAALAALLTAGFLWVDIFLSAGRAAAAGGPISPKRCKATKRGLEGPVHLVSCSIGISDATSAAISASVGGGFKTGTGSRDGLAAILAAPASNPIVVRKTIAIAIAKKQRPPSPN